MKLAMVQMPVTDDKNNNLQTACQQIEFCAQQGADMIVLPEMFVCPYETTAFLKNGEPRNGGIAQTIAASARQNQVYVVAGSFPEKEDSRFYNTSLVFNPKGEEIAYHRKLHLFDVSIKGGQHFCESDTFTAGDHITVFDTPYGRIGLMICFDLRFGELSRAMALDGAKLLIAPAAFNMTTGPMHWDLLLRARAVDNGVWVAGVSPARNETAPYVAYAHSAVASPWGNIVCRLSSCAECGFVDLNLDLCEDVQRQLPVLHARRCDLYQ